MSLSSENTNTSGSQLSYSLLLPHFPSSHLQSVSSEFLLPQSKTTHFLLLELLSLSSPDLLCLNLRASGTILPCVRFGVGCCKNWGEFVSFETGTRVFASWQCPFQQSCPVPFLPVSSVASLPELCPALSVEPTRQVRNTAPP